jgi:hypothetical protein
MGSVIVEFSQFFTCDGTERGDELLSPVYRRGLPSVGTTHFKRMRCLSIYSSLFYS